MSEETRRKIGEASRGRVWTEAQRKRHSEIFKGRQFTQEWKNRIKEGRKKYVGELASGYKHGKYLVIGRLRREAPPAPNVCEACGIEGSGIKGKLFIDHDHKTDAFRGWICHHCNVILGFAKDDVTTLESLIKYLRKHAI